MTRAAPLPFWRPILGRGDARHGMYMPAGQTGTPMTYMLGGKQYIVIAVGGNELSRRAAGLPAAVSLLLGRPHGDLVFLGEVRRNPHRDLAGGGPFRASL